MSGGSEKVVPVEEFDRLREQRRRAVTDRHGEPVDPEKLARAETGLPVRRLIRFGDGSFDVELDLNGGAPTRVPLGDATGVLNPRRFEALIADRTGLSIPYYGPKEWRPVARALLALAEVEDTGSTEAEETRAWIVSFLEDRVEEFPVSDSVRLGKVVRLAHAIRDPAETRLYLRIEELVKHVTLAFGQRTTRRDVAARLARLGFTKVQLSARVGEEVVKGRFFVSRPGFDPEED